MTQARSAHWITFWQATCALSEFPFSVIDVVILLSAALLILWSLQAKVAPGKNSLAEMPMVQQSPIDEQIRDYILHQERIDEARRQPAPISFKQERRKWERRLGYFILAGVAVVVFTLYEHFHNKSGQVVLLVLGGGALAFLGALIYVHGFLFVTEKLGYRAGLQSFKLTMASTGIVFFALWAAWAYAVLSGG